MHTIAIMQPYFFPYIGYFQTMKIVDEYVVYDNVQYIKNGWINRNNILINGAKHYITMQLSSTSPNMQINDIIVVDDFVKMKKTISMAYAKSQYFDEAFGLIYNILNYPNKNLADFLLNSYIEIFTYLGITQKIVKSSKIDFNTSLKGKERVIDICQRLGAKKYVNAIGGQDLYNKQDFLNNGIELKFVKSSFIEYHQPKNPSFMSGLSIIDVLMNNSKEEILKMLDSYELI